MINFVNVDAEKIKADLLSYFEQETGEVLADGDPIKLFVLSMVPFVVGFYNQLNYTGNMNLVQYAEKEYLDAIAQMFGASRIPAEKAKTTMKFVLSAVQANNIVIPSNTRVSAGGDMYFLTDTDLVIPAGSIEGTMTATAQNAGVSCNGFLPGTINKIVDQIAFVASAENTIISAGGKDVESDDDFRERIKNAPESFSVAGPVGAYEYWTKSVSQSIIDVAVESEAPGTVNVYPLTETGAISDALRSSIEDALNADERRPLTDLVVVSNPTAVNYSVNVSYTSENDVSEEINRAVDSYIAWQGQKLGRSINPDELRKRMLNAGAVTVTVTSPSYQTINSKSFAKNTSKTVVKT